MTSTTKTATSATDFGQELERLFGPSAFFAPLSSDDRMGRRIHGIDLTNPLSEGQAQLLVALLDRFSIISFPDQGHPSLISEEICAHQPTDPSMAEIASTISI